MELALGAIGKVFGGLAGTAGSSSGLLGGLQGFATAISALATLGTGMAGAAADRAEANRAELQAGQENVETMQKQTQMKRALLDVLGENEVTFASAGIDISSGIAQQAQADAKRRAQSELSIERSDADYRMAMHRMRASGLRRRAKGRVGGALLGAIGQGADYGISLAERG